MAASGPEMVILSASGVLHRVVFGADSLTGSSTVDPEEEVVHGAIRGIAAVAGSPYARRISDRLEELFAEAKIEDPDQVGIAPGSLHTFSLFYRRNPGLRCPALSLTPKHNIYATWKAGDGRLFSVHFLAQRNVRFVIFAPDRRHPQETVRLSGQVNVDTLLETIAPHDVLDWIME
jgi:hypothetical protein